MNSWKKETLLSNIFLYISENNVKQSDRDIIHFDNAKFVNNAQV